MAKKSVVTVNECHYNYYFRNLNLRTGDHIEMSSLNKKKSYERKTMNNSVGYYLLFCNHSPSSYHFSIMIY